MSTAWMILFLAGLLEICWAIGLKYTEGFTRLLPSLFTGLMIPLSLFLLAKASQTLPIGTAYTVWVGIGALGTSLLGILLFKEPATAGRIFFLGLLIVSIVGLKLTHTS
jgi:quaternary ammonium compound-resistance protein SugE